MTILDIETIKKYLPHRYPFILIDKITELTSKTSITAVKNVSVNEPFFQGHFPGRSIFPGVLIVEAMAQASGILAYDILEVVNPEDEKALFFFAGIDSVRFKRMVVPGDQMILKIDFNKRRRNLWKFSGVATVNGDIACHADFLIVEETLD